MCEFSVVLLVLQMYCDVLLLVCFEMLKKAALSGTWMSIPTTVGALVAV